MLSIDSRWMRYGDLGFPSCSKFGESVPTKFMVLPPMNRFSQTVVFSGSGNSVQLHFGSESLSRGSPEPSGLPTNTPLKSPLFRLAIESTYEANINCTSSPHNLRRFCFNPT